jgi:hypothetical protein
VRCPDPAAAILTESLALAIEQHGVSDTSIVAHVCWPTEFPLTLCGEIATETTPLLSLTQQGPDCETCRLLMAACHSLSRPNPHR